MINGMECLATIPRNHPNHPDHPEGPLIHRLGGHTSLHTISRSLSSFGLAASAAFSASRRSGATVIVGSWCRKPSSREQISHVSQFDCPSRPRCNIYVVISREIAFWYQSRSKSHYIVFTFVRQKFFVGDLENRTPLVPVCIPSSLVIGINSKAGALSKLVPTGLERERKIDGCSVGPYCNRR